MIPDVLNRPFARYTLARVGQALLTILLVYVVVFVVLTVLPGDPISLRLSDPQSGFTPEQIATVTAYYGLNKPFLVQLGDRLYGLLSWDWGLSLTDSRPVWEVISTSLPSTLQLASFAFVLSLVIATFVVLGSRYAPWAALRGAFRAFPSLFMSFPNFLLGLIFIQIFAFQLGLFHVTDPQSFQALLFPAISLAIPVSAPVAQVLNTGLDQSSQQPYAVVALSKGLSEPKILTRHLLKPASLPVLTIIGIIAGDLLAGSVLTEYVYGRDGIGSLVQRSAIDQDVPLLQAIVVLAATVFIFINLAVDLLYQVLDPRVKLQAR